MVYSFLTYTTENSGLMPFIVMYAENGLNNYLKTYLVYFLYRGELNGLALYPLVAYLIIYLTTFIKQILSIIRHVILLS